MNYLKAPSDSLATIFLASPGTYPVFNGLNIVQQQYVNSQLDDMYAAHQFYSDLDKTTIQFLSNQCQ